MKRLLNSLNFFEKVLPVFVFISLFFLFRSIDSNILLDSGLPSGGILLSKMWRFLFQNGIMPLIYSLSLFFIILSSNGKKEKIRYETIETISFLGKILFILAIIIIGFCFKSNHGIFLIVAKGLTVSTFYALILLVFFLLYLLLSYFSF